ncbi:MAG: hypothetical protein HYU56_00830 [Candidatus Aenigmarchaeota archaeon]|nr:hypothetical protein [Candidatus Aenigmarchaeota archaeon]
MRKMWLLIIPLLLVSSAYAEFTGTINITTLTNSSYSVVTGLLGYTVKYCEIESQCFGYRCYNDYDGEVDDSDTSQPSGVCNATSTTFCFHDNKWLAAATNVCNSNVTYRTCLTNETGKWSGLNTCASGETCSAGADNAGNCTAASSSSSSSSGSGGGSSSDTTLKHSISLVSGISDFEAMQGGTILRTAKFKNNGNITLTNVTIVLDVPESWYGANPPKFASINQGKEDQFNITFFIPKDAAIKNYQVNAEIKTHKSNVSATFSFLIKVTPSNETVQTTLVPKYSELVAALQLVEDNISLLNLTGIDEGNITYFRNVAETIRSKINQVNLSLERGDYFTANSLLNEAELLLNDLTEAIKNVKTPEKPFDLLLVSVVAFVIIIVIFLMYLLVPQRKKKVA